MKSTLKFALLMTLLVSNAFADGDMGTGGFTGDMGTGGITCTENCDAEGETPITENGENEEDDSLLTFVQNYLANLLGS